MPVPVQLNTQADILFPTIQNLFIIIMYSKLKRREILIDFSAFSVYGIIFREVP